jgi:pimeloyl-ACP methyl ester carboxylesterase
MKPKSTNPLKHLHLSDIRGMAKLMTQATAGVTHIVEGVHRSVWDAVGLPGSEEPGQTRGVTGLVYKSVRSVTQLVGGGVDAALAGLHPLLETAEEDGPDTARRTAALAAINGVVGDHLIASKNPLAISMTLRYQGQSLDWQSPPSMPEATGKALLLIHGLCMNDLQWRTERDGHAVDHGQALAAALGYTPLYLRYNSGRHISQNGSDLSALLEQLVTHWPVALEELTVVAHSMGGLLIRSAFHHGKEKGMRWPDRLNNIVFLGTPHHGAPLERIGNWVDVLLGSTPYTAPFARLGHIRSAGVTDLRYGYLLDEEWRGRDRFHRKPDARQIVSLPEGVACYAVAATTASRRGLLADQVIGDGLVPLNSALGQHKDPRRNLAFAESSQWIAYRTNHMALLSSPAVTRRMVEWLGDQS